MKARALTPRAWAFAVFAFVAISATVLGTMIASADGSMRSESSDYSEYCHLGESECDHIGITAGSSDGRTVDFVHTKEDPESSDAGGVFVFGCKPAHQAQVDPITSPGIESSHLHQFIGNTTTNADSTYDSMLSQPTTCEEAGDTAAYWVPVMLDNADEAVPLYGITVYYRDWPDSGHAVTTFPPDYRIISGFPNPQKAAGIQASATGGNWGYSCDNTEPLQPTSAIDCTGDPKGTRVIAVVFFPQCGTTVDGSIVTDSPDHRSHAAFAGSNGCPAGTVKLPLLYIKVKYAISNCITAGCHLTSDGQPINGQVCLLPGCTLHADYWNTWDQGALDTLVNSKLNA